MAHWLRNLRIYRLMDHEGPWKIIIPQAGVTLFLGNTKISRSCNSHTKPRFLCVFMVVLKCLKTIGESDCSINAIFSNPILPGFWGVWSRSGRSSSPISMSKQSKQTKTQISLAGYLPPISGLFFLYQYSDWHLTYIMILIQVQVPSRSVFGAWFRGLRWVKYLPSWVFGSIFWIELLPASFTKVYLKGLHKGQSVFLRESLRAVHRVQWCGLPRQKSVDDWWLVDDAQQEILLWARYTVKHSETKKSDPQDWLRVHCIRLQYR